MPPGQSVPYSQDERSHQQMRLPAADEYPPDSPLAVSFSRMANFVRDWVMALPPPGPFAVVGPPGCGKTGLLLQMQHLASGLRSQYHDDVWDQLAVRRVSPWDLIASLKKNGTIADASPPELAAALRGHMVDKTTKKDTILILDEVGKQDHTDTADLLLALRHLLGSLRQARWQNPNRTEDWDFFGTQDGQQQRTWLVLGYDEDAIMVALSGRLGSGVPARELLQELSIQRYYMPFSQELRETVINTLAPKDLPGKFFPKTFFESFLTAVASYRIRYLRQTVTVFGRLMDLDYVGSSLVNRVRKRLRDSPRLSGELTNSWCSTSSEPTFQLVLALWFGVILMTMAREHLRDPYLEWIGKAANLSPLCHILQRLDDLLSRTPAGETVNPSGLADLRAYLELHGWSVTADALGTTSSSMVRWFTRTRDLILEAWNQSGPYDRFRDVPLLLPRSQCFSLDPFFREWRLEFWRVVFEEYINE